MAEGKLEFGGIRSNYHPSSMRQSIERAFGFLTRRWGIFWRPMSCDYGRWNIIAQVCAQLHNVCIDFGLEEIVSTMPENYAEGDSAARGFLHQCKSIANDRKKKLG